MSDYGKWNALFLSGMNPMTNYQNCTLRQSLVNCQDLCVCTRMSLQDMSAGILEAIICMPEVLYCNSAG